MRILHCLYYYRPHYSGLTVYTERLARALVRRGHSVTVLSARYDRRLPAEETLEGVRVRRAGVAFFVSKGPIMPAFQPLGWSLAGEHDVVHLHVPQIDAALLAAMARLRGKSVVMTFHCDLSLPRSPLNRLANVASHLADRTTARLASAVVTNTRDYAEASPLLRHHLDNLVVIPPPIEVTAPTVMEVENFRARLGLLPGQKVIGMAARLATEKGAEILAQAMPVIAERYPQARVLYVGQYRDVMGEDAYARRLQPMLDRLGDRWTFLGVLARQRDGCVLRRVRRHRPAQPEQHGELWDGPGGVDGLRHTGGCQRSPGRTPTDSHDRHGAHGPTWRRPCIGAGVGRGPRPPRAVRRRSAGRGGALLVGGGRRRVRDALYLDPGTSKMTGSAFRLTIGPTPAVDTPPDRGHAG